jgi:site-specific DNA recombinase
MSEHQQQDGQQGGVAVYLRVSGEDQRRKGTIENQRPDLDRYLNAYALAPYAWYEDEAVSGAWVPFGERPQGRRLLADAQAGHVQLVLVWRLDRFGRNAYEILGAVRELERAGARLVSLKEAFDTRTPPGRLMLGILASVAEFEWESIVERAEAGIDRKLDGGGWMGGPVPYGYRVEGAAPHARLVPDETPLGIPEYPSLSAADVVRLIYALTVDEHKSGGDIADRLNAMHVPTSFQRRGLTRYRRPGSDVPALHIWRPDTVIVILNNPTNKGVYTFGRYRRHNRTRERQVVTIVMPALVSVENVGRRTSGARTSSVLERAQRQARLLAARPHGVRPVRLSLRGRGRLVSLPGTPSRKPAVGARAGRHPPLPRAAAEGGEDRG